MGFMDRLKDKLTQNRDKVETGMDKAAKAADSMTKGKYRDRIESGTDKAKGALGRFTGGDRRDDGPSGTDEGGRGPDRG
ncbi:antitoxin [Streptomyces litchfieldiae]|uniref:Antitoxin n=1 Tax=Streptomyces litchfieldiae TaxID=3075543 RepID=A0ABU2N093_9ACTN|nr:antitoxin [Streptomyces sp. DSM 44938]MDT0347315.1 antitoxin [Streptomyces sp. DSM 44938]